MSESKIIPESRKITNLQFIVMMIIAVIVWAFAFPFIKIGLEELSFINLTIMRFLIVCIIFIIIFILMPKKFSKLHRKDIIPISILGFFGVIVYHFGLNYGEQFISPGIASLIIATIPIQIIILARVILKEIITFKKFIGIILALIGVLIISIWGKAESTLEIEYIFGALAILIAAIMAALYTIAGKRLLERYNGLSLTVYAMLFGSIGLIPFISQSFIIQVESMTPKAWFAVIFLGLFSTVIGYVIWYIALKIKSASEISIYLYAIPVLSTIISFFWFKDEITLMFIVGGFLVLIGLFIVNKKSKKISNKKID